MSHTSKPILITEPVFKGFKGGNSEDPSITKSWWKPQSLYVPGYSNQIYGGDVFFTAFKDE